MSVSTLARVKPTRRTLLDLKAKKELAVRAHKLLEQKHTVLREELVSIEGVLSPLREKMRSDLSKAYLSLDEACEELGINGVVAASHFIVPNSEVVLRKKISRGLFVPELVSTPQSRKIVERGYSLHSTSPSFDYVVGLFQEVLSSVSMIAELEGIRAVYESETRKTRMKVEALERILIPWIEETVKRIENKLEENERQALFVVRRIRERRTERTLGLD